VSTYTTQDLAIFMNQLLRGRCTVESPKVQGEVHNATLSYGGSSPALLKIPAMSSGWITGLSRP